ncbi:MAG: hypothetical protein RBS68_07980 [Anaerolineales bacterium]|jgi:hypothetical protein|nr:hypothetical protein [Anaerolineales bacterium]
MNTRPGRILFWIGLTLLLAPLACGPVPEAVAPEATEEPAYPQAVATPLEILPTPSLVAPQPALSEARMLTLEFPPRLRAGDSELIHLTLEVDDHGQLTATAETGGNLTQGQVIQIPNIYDTHYVWAEARLDMAGVQISPAGAISESLRPGQKLRFSWSVRAEQVGRYRGTLWFYLRFSPIAGGPEERLALSSQKIEIEAVNFFGLKAQPARWLGALGTVLSAVLGMPFLEGSLKWLWARQPKTRRSTF